MKELGFKCMVFGNTNCAIYFSQQLKVFRQESLTLCKAVKQFNQGNYVAFVPGHAIAMQNGKLDQQYYPVGFTITQSGNFLVKHTTSTVVIVKTFTEVEQEFEKFVKSLNTAGV